jgi:phage tail tape-measure protein
MSTAVVADHYRKQVRQQLQRAIQQGSSYLIRATICEVIAEELEKLKSEPELGKAPINQFAVRQSALEDDEEEDVT